jgi:hypothetical protein
LLHFSTAVSFDAHLYRGGGTRGTAGYQGAYNIDNSACKGEESLELDIVLKLSMILSEMDDKTW